MKLNSRVKQNMCTPLSGTPGTGVIGASTILKLDIFSGTLPTKAELDLIYSSNMVLTSGVPTIPLLANKIVALGKTLLGSASISNVKVSSIGMLALKYDLNNNVIIPTVAGEATFLLMHFNYSGTTSTACMFIFSVGAKDSGADIIIIDNNLVVGTAVNLSTISLKLNIGEAL